MQVVINGEQTTLNIDAVTLAGLLEQLGHNRAQVALEHNGNIIRRALHDETYIHDGDRIEIVTFVGGG